MQNLRECHVLLNPISEYFNTLLIVIDEFNQYLVVLSSLCGTLQVWIPARCLCDMLSARVEFRVIEQTNSPLISRKLRYAEGYRAEVPAVRL